jgi:hypothetical protein
MYMYVWVVDHKHLLVYRAVPTSAICVRFLPDASR